MKSLSLTIQSEIADKTYRRSQKADFDFGFSKWLTIIPQAEWLYDQRFAAIMNRLKFSIFDNREYK